MAMKGGYQVLDMSNPAINIPEVVRQSGGKRIVVSGATLGGVVIPDFVTAFAEDDTGKYSGSFFWGGKAYRISEDGEVTEVPLGGPFTGIKYGNYRYQYNGDGGLTSTEEEFLSWSAPSGGLRTRDDNLNPVLFSATAYLRPPPVTLQSGGGVRTIFSEMTIPLQITTIALKGVSPIFQYKVGETTFQYNIKVDWVRSTDDVTTEIYCNIFGTERIAKLEQSWTCRITTSEVK